MIDLTPLDVRKKRGDFAKGVRGYSTQEVDSFLELVAERLEELVKENLTLRERADRLAEQVLTLMEEGEARRAEEQIQAEGAGERERRLAAVVEEYESGSVRLRRELEELSARRRALVERLERELVRRYDRLRARHNNLAVVRLREGVCPACHVAVPSDQLKALRSALRPQNCESCGRLLVWCGEA